NASSHADALAFQVSERARARSLIELLESAVEAKMAPEERAQKEALRDEIRRAERELQNRMGGHATVEAIAEQDAHVSALLADYEAREGSAQTSADPPTIGEIAKLIDPGTVWLEYHLAEERSFLWVIRPQGFELVVLPDKRTIEELAQRTSRAWTARNIYSNE